MLSRLSLPPLASCVPDGDHLRPQTSCVWPERADLVLLLAHVVVDDRRVAAARREHRAVPRERRDARAVAVHRAHLLELLDVPDLHLVVGRADGHVVALADPRERGDVRLLALRLHQLLDRAVRGVPQVDRVAERDAEHVGRGPVEQVEVVVVE